MEMKINFKTLDQRTFSLNLDETCRTVEDLICMIEDTLGRDHLYKLIFSGKLLKEEHALSDYKLNSKVPIIVMVTKAQNIQQNIVGSKYEEEMLTDNSLENADFKRNRTVTEDSGIEEDLEGSDHFVSDAEFDSVLEIILSCSYLIDKDDNHQLSNKEIQELVHIYCQESEVGEDFAEIFRRNLSKIVTKNINKSQMMALLEDVHDIYEEPREKLGNNSNGSVKDFDTDFDSSDEDMNDKDEDDEMNNEAKIERLVDMGFNAEEARDALEKASNILSVAVEILMPSPQPSFSSRTMTVNNPLAFLRDIEEFQFLRFQVLHDPSILQPLLISFGQSHPDLMKIINQNKDIFISMLHEQTGAKLHGRH